MPDQLAASRRRSATRSRCCSGRSGSSTGSPRPNCWCGSSPTSGPWTPSRSGSPPASRTWRCATGAATGWPAAIPAGRLAVWRELTSHVGPGRAAHVVDVRRPRNPADEPHRTSPGQVVLVVAETDRCPRPTAPPAVTVLARGLPRGPRDRRPACRRRRARRGRRRYPRGANPRQPARRAGPRARDGRPADADVLVAFLDLPAAGSAPTRGAATWTAPARARLLPDRFTLLGYAGGQLVLDVTGNPVPADLAVGPDPGTRRRPVRTEPRTASARAGRRCPGSSTSTRPSPWGWRSGSRSPTRSASGLDRLVVLGLRVP